MSIQMKQLFSVSTDLCYGEKASTDGFLRLGAAFYGASQGRAFQSKLKMKLIEKSPYEIGYWSGKGKHQDISGEEEKSDDISNCRSWRCLPRFRSNRKAQPELQADR